MIFKLSRFNSGVPSCILFPLNNLFPLYKFEIYTQGQEPYKEDQVRFLTTSFLCFGVMPLDWLKNKNEPYVYYGYIVPFFVFHFISNQGNVYK